MKKLIIALFASIATMASAATNCIVTWDSTTDTNVVGYHIYYGCATGNYTNKVTVGGLTTTNATIPNMRPWRVYFLVATAYDNSGLESVPSNEVAWTNRGAAPMNLRVQP